MKTRTSVQENLEHMRTKAAGQWITVEDLYRHQKTHPTFDAEALRRWLAQRGAWQNYTYVADANMAMKKNKRNRRRGFSWVRD